MSRKFLLVIIALLMTISGANAHYHGGYSNNNRDKRDDDDRDRRGRELKIIGLTSDQRLIRFDEDNPEDARTIGMVSGLGPDTSLVGIDFRVQDGKLYGVGNQGGVYTIDTNYAIATFVNSLTVPLNGASFGVDFNPAADRLRIISDTGQNLRHNVNAGGVTIADATLNYTAGTAATGVTGAAYTNNDLDPNTGTTLLDLDSNMDQVAVQSPPNNGSLVATGKLTVDTTPAVGFDIYSTIRNGTTFDVEAFASLTSALDGRVRFYEINLFTGKATQRGRFKSQDQVIDIAIPLSQR
jgi:Domain of unknown function (DUF4394)